MDMIDRSLRLRRLSENERYWVWQLHDLHYDEIKITFFSCESEQELCAMQSMIHVFHKWDILQTLVCMHAPYNIAL